MRYSELYEKRSQVETYYHVTAARNVPSIMKHGLVANHANNGVGRYDDRWQSLNGIYASKSINLIKKIAYHMGEPIAVVVLSVSPKSGLPDEDIIELLIRKAYEYALDTWGIDHYYYETPGEYFEHAKEAGEPTDFTMEDVWKSASEQFHKLASKNDPHIHYNAPLIDELIDYWVTYALDEFQSGENDPSRWMELKDIVSRIYRRTMESNDYKTSLRFDGPITFKGRNRITAIVTSDGIIYGYVSNEENQVISELF